MGDDRDDRREDGDPPESEDLDERVAELEQRVRDLRAELGRPPEGPLGLPRPPTPRKVLSFTGEYAIPTAIAVLEANVRALQALQQVIRVLDPKRSAVDEERDRLESRAADASRATLDRLESVLADVEETVQENDLPRESEARDVLEDARRINREIRERVERERRAADEARERERTGGRKPERAGTGDRERADDAQSDRDDSGLEGATRIELTDEGETGDDGEEETVSDVEGEAGDDAERGKRSDAEGDASDDAATDGRGEVDVEAELQSIKDEMESCNQTEAPDRDAETGDAGETDEAETDRENTEEDE